MTAASDRGTETVRPELDLEALTAKHYAVEWQECSEDGIPDLTKPLPPFCAACTDEEYVGAVEFGDTIDAAADVVSWPCVVVELVTEVQRLRADVPHIEAAVRADERAKCAAEIRTQAEAIRAGFRHSGGDPCDGLNNAAIEGQWAGWANAADWLTDALGIRAKVEAAQAELAARASS